MPRKRASGSSPDKPVATPRRNTRRGRNKSEEPEEVPAEIPRHLLRGSDESTEESDNDSDYGSPKKGRGRGRTTGRGRKPKEPPTDEKPTPRPRRGRRAAAAAKDASPDHTGEERDYSQSTQETTENEASDPNKQPTVYAQPEPEIADSSLNETVEIVDSPPTFEPVTQDIEADKVSEVTIEQDLQSNNDQAPVNDEEEDASKDNDDVETGRESVADVIESSEVVEEKVDSPLAEPEKVEVIEDESKDAPESSANQSDSRSNSSEKEVYAKHRQRDRSSSGEIVDEKMEVDSSMEILNKPKAPEPPVEKAVEEPKKAETVKEKSPVVEEKAAAPIQRKRKWTARKTDEKPVIAITTDSLKNIISDEVKPVPLSDVKLLSMSPEPQPEEKRQRTKPTADDKDAKKKLLKERLRKQEEEEERRNEQLVKAIDKPSNGATSNGTAILKDRKVSIIVEDQALPPSPPKNQSSSILFITNLVRPFTVLQLKGLLARTGKIVENGFWIDKIKSKCYVRYETEDEAVETRHALHGVTWPPSNPKCLNVDFGKEEDMEKAVISTLEEMPRIQITAENRDVKEEKEFGWSKDPYKTTSGVDDRSRGAHSRPVREWDVGKKEQEDRDREDRDRNRRKRSSERESRRDKDIKKEERPDKRRSMSESPGRKTEKVEGEPQPVRLLDDLFRKTKATPCIYWLPLSAEQIIEKEEQRQKNLAEHERRMEEIRKQREERMREKRRSNSRDRRRERSHERRRRSVSRDRRYNRR